MATTSLAALRHSLRLFWRLVRLVRSFWGAMSREISLGLLVQVAALAPPYLTKLLIDRAYPQNDPDLVTVLVGLLFAVSVGKCVLRGVRDYYRLHVTTGLNKLVRSFFFNHVQHLPYGFFNTHRVGEIMSRFNDVDSSIAIVGSTFSTLLLSGIYLLAIPPLLFALDWRLALIALVGVPLNILVTTMSGRILNPYWRRLAEASANLRAFQVEAFSHIPTFKGFALEGYLHRKNEEALEAVVAAQKSTGRISHSFGMVSGVLQAAITGAYTYLGWQMILAGSLSLGDLIAFAAYVAMLLEPLSGLIGLFSQIQGTAVHIERMFEYTDLETEQAPETAARPLRSVASFAGALDLDAVCFGYSPEVPVLRDVDLRVEGGTRVAIVGPSGSGKTSLLKLLTRLERPTSGTIRLDDKPVDEIPLPMLRSAISVVWQEPAVFQGSLWDNLTVGAPDAERRDVDRVVELCRLYDFVGQLPHGYETPISEWGGNLSGGQKQRLMLARALLRQSRILLLDEVTSNIDVETELAMMRDLFDELDDVTILFVTHRPASAALADAVIELQGGRLHPRPTSVAAGRGA